MCLGGGGGGDQNPKGTICMPHGVPAPTRQEPQDPSFYNGWDLPLSLRWEFLFQIGKKAVFQAGIVKKPYVKYYFNKKVNKIEY